MDKEADGFVRPSEGECAGQGCVCVCLHVLN